ncbi:DUF7144 family membrane protein [Streptomyces catenulae]|uniref:DUF7144 domain-containing protein n=1 Tax=Streptomyces catenulae TaxID=66875 RepID=A0ABV2Z1T2_9ACTN|nr:hypothetical protein [Streptomyces catenulae]
MAHTATPHNHPQHGDTTESPTRAWAVGGTVFAGIVLIVGGILDILKGITALSSDAIYTTVNQYVYRFDLTAWGWVLVALGIVAVITGLGLLTDAMWARILGVMMASLSLIANFMWLPYQPLWAIISIALAAWVIWALCAHRPQHPTL